MCQSKPYLWKNFDEENLVNDLKMSFNIKTVHKQVLLSNNEDKVHWYTMKKKNDRSVGFGKDMRPFKKKILASLHNNLMTMIK